MKKKVLIVTPRSPFQGRGADAEDRLSGVRWFVGHGYEVRVITMTMPNDVPYVLDAEKTLGIKITPVPYTFNAERTARERVLRLLRRIIWPPFWDGAAYEYFGDEIQAAVRDEIADFKPDLAVFDYSYLWPLYSLASKRNIPIVTRSINMEPLHFLDEDGRSFLNYLRSIPKWISEILVSRKSALVFAITPKEQRIYSMLGAKARTLPLRGLPAKLVEWRPRVFLPLDEVHVGFTASTYNVAHNLSALKFLTEQVMPLLRGTSKHYILHFTGSKLPATFEAGPARDVVNEGFVPSMADFWNRMDIAVVPSLFGAGMQQKVFEPLLFGVPTITSARAIAGYPFTEQEVRFATSAEEYAEAIQSLARDDAARELLSSRASALSEDLFSQDALDAIVTDNVPL